MRDCKLAPYGAALAALSRLTKPDIGKMAGHADQVGPGVRNMVVTLVERGGLARSFHTDGHSIADIVPIVREHQM